MSYSCGSEHPNEHSALIAELELPTRVDTLEARVATLME